MLHSSGTYSWKFVNDTENGILTLYDATRNYYSRLSNEGWFLKEPEDLDFWFYREGSWSTERPTEIINGTRTFEICQRGVNNCADGGDQPGCCGPRGNRRHCDFSTNRCFSI